MPRGQKYDNEMFLDIINKVKPVGAEMWDMVALEYQKRANEVLLRDSADIKRYFQEKLCNKMQTITGTSRAALSTRRAQDIYQKFLRKEAGSFVGGSSDDEDSSSSSDDGDGVAGDRDEVDDIRNTTPTIDAVENNTEEHQPDKVTKSKRKRHDADYDNGKTKNSRFGESPNGRSSVAATMQGLAKAVSNMEQSSVIEQLMAAQQQQTTMMMQMMQQQQQQASQQQSTMMMMFMTMLNRQSSSSSSSNSAAPSMPFTEGFEFRP